MIAKNCTRDKPPPALRRVAAQTCKARPCRFRFPAAASRARAPHAWLAPDKSTLDLFGDGFVLLAFADVATEPLARAAAARAVPLAVHRVADAQTAALHGAKLVLVRPDGHVAWRGDALPPSCEALIDTVRGAGARVAARRAASAVAAT